MRRFFKILRSFLACVRTHRLLWVFRTAPHRPLSPGGAIAVDAVDLPAWDHRDPADRLIVASAPLLDAVLVSRDGAIRDYATAASAVRVLDPGR
jgi:hypothetical protein